MLQRFPIPPLLTLYLSTLNGIVPSLNLLSYKGAPYFAYTKLKTNNKAPVGLKPYTYRL